MPLSCPSCSGRPCWPTCAAEPALTPFVAIPDGGRKTRPPGEYRAPEGCQDPQEPGMVAGAAGRHTGAVPTALTLERVRRDVEVLAHAGLDTATFLAEVYGSLQRAVPSDAACAATLDPATQLTTGAFKLGELAGRNDTDESWGLLEYGHVEPTSFTELARAGVPAVDVHLATGGDARRSRPEIRLQQDRGQHPSGPRRPGLLRPVRAPPRWTALPVGVVPRYGAHGVTRTLGVSRSRRSRRQRRGSVNPFAQRRGSSRQDSGVAALR